MSSFRNLPAKASLFMAFLIFMMGQAKAQENPQPITINGVTVTGVWPWLPAGQVIDGTEFKQIVEDNVAGMNLDSATLATYRQISYKMAFVYTMTDNQLKHFAKTIRNARRQLRRDIKDTNREAKMIGNLLGSDKKGILNDYRVFGQVLAGIYNDRFCTILM